MSWRATAAVKQLTHGTDGKAITAREKLALFVLADYYNDEAGCAWASLATIAREALTTRRHIVRILESLRGKGVLGVEHRATRSNLYTFPGLGVVTPCHPEQIEMVTSGHQVVTQLSLQGSDTAVSPKREVNGNKNGKGARSRHDRGNKAQRIEEANRQVAASFASGDRR